MRIWLRRSLAYLLVPVGLVLLFFPLSTHRMGEAERDFLFLENSADLLAAEKPAGAASSPPTEAGSLEQKIERMNDRRRKRAQEEARAAEVINPHGYPRIRPEDLAPYPALLDAVETLQRIWAYIPSRFNRQDAVSIGDWNDFRAAAGLSEEDQAFQYGRYIFKGRVKAESVSVPMEVTHLRAGCKVAGALFLLVGFGALCRIYTRPPDSGIRVGRRSAIIIWDVAIILVGLVFTWWFVEFVLAEGFRTATEWGEDFAVGMGIFWVVLANPVLALITSAMSAQTLWITGDEIAQKGLFGSSSVRWDELEGIAVTDAFTPRKAGGVPAPHRVMKILQIHGGGYTLRVLEPPYASTKKLILETLAERAPDEWKERIAAVAKEWLSKW